MPSRDKKARAGAPAAGGRPVSRPASPASAVPAPPVSAEQAKPALQVSRRALKNWRVRSRLLLLIIIPTLTAVVRGKTVSQTIVLRIF